MSQLKNQKNIVHDEPVWKKRRKEYHKQQRKTKLWTALVAALIVIALGFLGYQATSMWNRANTVKRKEKPAFTIATVVDKHVVQKNGKDDHVVTFRVSVRNVDKSVSRKDYDTLKKGQDVKIGYKGQPRLGTVEIVSWQPLKLEK